MCGEFGFFFSIQSLKKTQHNAFFLERFFQAIHFIIVADEGASHRAVTNVLHLVW